jgi:hypothetical protein
LRSHGLNFVFIVKLLYYKYHTDAVEFSDRLLGEAERINQVKFVRTFYYPTASEFSKYSEYSKSSDPKTDLIAFVFHLFFSCHSLTYAQNQIPEMDIPTLPADRAKKAIEVMNFLVHRYPFPEAMGVRSNTFSVFDPKPIVFKDIAEVAKWVEDLGIIVDRIRTMPLGIEWRIPICLSALKSQDKEIDETLKKRHAERTIIGEIDPYIIYNNYMDSIKTAYEISRSVKFYLNRVNMLGSRFVPKAQIIMVIVFTFFVFFSGVILPLLTDRVLRVTLIFIPCFFYIVAFTFLLYRLSI